jgi:hypothetical protein
MRGRDNPSVRLGSELQLYIVELAKRDRLAAGAPEGQTDRWAALAAWVKYFQHWKEPDIMNQITWPPVLEAMRILTTLSSDEETRRLADVRERALMTELTELRAAERRGEARGANEANARAIRSAMQKGMTEAQAREFLDLPEP